MFALSPGFALRCPCLSSALAVRALSSQPRENARASLRQFEIPSEIPGTFSDQPGCVLAQQPRRKVAGTEPAALCHIEGGVRAHFAFCQRGTTMRNSLWAAVSVLTISLAPTGGAQADTVGAAAGAGTGLVVAGPVGAVVGGVVGAVWGRPFWGPPHSPYACWIDNHFYRHCRWSHGHW